MKTSVQKWGNSLALRIPKSLAEELGIREGDGVELTQKGDALLVKPLPEAHPTLAELLAEITDDNLHEPWDTGAPQGREVW